MSIRFTCARSEFNSWISLLIFCLVDLSNIDSGMVKSPTIIVWKSKSLCKSLRTCLIYLGAPVLGPYRFRIVSSSCCIYPFIMSILFIIMQCPFLSLLIFVSLTSILSETRIATPAFFFALHLLGKSSSIPLF